jgi:Flp pilus assembly pilin Flp
MEGGENRMLLQGYTYVKVGLGHARSRIHDRLVDVMHGETGATAAEYALLVSLIAIAIIVGATNLGKSINTRLDTTATSVGTAGS